MGFKWVATSLFIVFLSSLSFENARADVSWSTGTITPGDYTSSGIVTITGAVSFDPGTYTFSSLVVNSGVTLTIKGNTGTGTGVIINATTVTITGTMSADGQGYPTQTGPGTGGSATSNGAGAGYGGAGGNGTTQTGGGTYGSVSQPVDLGSGGGKQGSGSGIGGTGGGAIKINASGTVTVNGTLSANGNNGASGFSAGGGSGGSIWIIANTLAGAGTIRANGGAWGSGSGGGGGGGRIAATYGTLTYSGTWSVSGGTGYNGGGAAGSAILYKATTNDISCVSAVATTLTGADVPTPTGSISVSNGCALTVPANTSPTTISIGASSSLTTLGAITPSGNVTVTGAGSSLNLNGNMTSTTGNLTLTTSATVTVIGDTVTGYGYTISMADISIDGTSSIHANGLGYPQQQGTGVGGNGTSSAGGGYGGAGGDGNASSAIGGATYGTVTSPTLIGSGGGLQGTVGTGGTGGGAIKIVASGTLTVSGTLAANGTNGRTGYSAGGGSGGSLWIVAGTFAGAGTITANGGTSGSGGGGGGGGGRIHVAYSSSMTFSGTLAANGGVGFVNGSKGTVFVQNSSNGNISCTVASTVVLTSSDIVGSIGTVLVTNGCDLTLPGGVNTGAITVNTAGVLTFQGFINVAGNITVADASSKLQVQGDIIAPSGTISLTSSASLLAIGNTITGTGSTIAATGITIDSTSSLNANGLGYPQQTGPGTGVSSSTGGGGGYGGAGGNGNTAAGGSTYGSALQPVDLGSGGGRANTLGIGGTGGGAMKIIVSGTLSVAGTIAANGTNGASGFNGGGGSGGSIWIDASTISGAGSITARGGNSGSGSGGGGGGGRIFYGYTTNSFTGTWSVAGGLGINNGGVGTINSAVVGTATKLIFLTQPSSLARKNEAFVTQPQVAATDASNNIVTTYSTAMTLTAFTNAACTTAAGGTFTVGSSTTAFGMTWFTGVKYSTPVTTIYLKATSGGLTTACSSAIAVGGGPATQLVITTQASTPNAAGAVFGTQPVVVARDASGDPDYLYTTTLNHTPYSDNTCTTLDVGGTLTGSGSWSLGSQTRTNQSYTKSGVFYIGFSSGSLSVCSAAITINAGTATYIAFSTQPSSTATAGVDFTQQPVVTAYDTYGNVATGYSTAITLTPFTNGSCTTAGTGTLSGGSSATTTSGVAAYSGVDYTRSGSLRLKATSGGFTDCSSLVTVSAGPAAAVAFTTNPSATGVTNVNLNTQPVVTVQDAYGNTATSYSTAVTLSPFTNAGCTTAGGGTLNGSATTTSGVATFSNVRYTVTGTFYIRASSGALTTACSPAIALIPNIPMMFRGY